MTNEVTMRVYNKTLDPKLWDENLQLDPEVRIALLKVGKDFYTGTELQAPLIDIFLIGSSANYNWTPESDLDVHIVIDISGEGINPTYTRKFMDGLGSAWNKDHELEIKGHPVEVYLQDQTEPNGSPKTFREGVAVYSLLHGNWAVRPKPEDIKIDKDAIKNKYRQLKNQINQLIASEDYTSLKALMKKIKTYRAAGLKANGEYSTENLVFKALRHTGILERMKDGLKSSYNKMVNIDEVITNKPFIVTGMTAQDLDVVGEKYYEGQQMITHGQLRSKYGNWGGSQDWRYRSDINVLFYWGLPDEDDRTATKDYLATKHNIRNPKEINAKQATDQIKQLVHYPFMVPGRNLFEIDESNAYYVVGIVTDNLNVIAKRYGKRENYITHDQLYKQYGLDYDSGVGWRYHSLGNWIFWWKEPTSDQKEEVVDYLTRKFGVLNPKHELPHTILRESKMQQKPYLVVGLVNSDFEVVGVRDYGVGDKKGTHSIDHGDLQKLARGQGFHFFSPATDSHWRYKSINDTLYWWAGDTFNEDLKDVVLDYLHTKFNVKNPKINRDKNEYFSAGHFIMEGIYEAGQPDKVYYGNVDDENHVNSVRWFNVADELPGGNHFGEGNRWRFRTTFPYVFWWEDMHEPTTEQKEAVEFYLYKKFGIKPKGHKMMSDIFSASAFTHGLVDKRKAQMKEAKFNPKKAKELQFVTYGGLSLTKQKGYDPDKFKDDSAWFHSPPSRRGIYAFVWPFVEKFLLSGDYADPKIRGKGQRQRVQYVKDKFGNVVTSDHPEFEKHSDIPKNWSFARKRTDAPGQKQGSDEFEYDKEYYRVLYRNSPRKKFSYNGPLWHHLTNGVTPDKILDEKGAWIKTDMDTYRDAFSKELHSMHSQKARSGYGTSLDHMEVFIDQKI